MPPAQQFEANGSRRFDVAASSVTRQGKLHQGPNLQSPSVGDVKDIDPYRRPWPRHGADAHNGAAPDAAKRPTR
ncbi:hypothetical protein MMAN_07480 [Mycobacterium mantenii]|uniref:Uncharacterized protein n=1 Tax=Mycobacterium mantenii TaxID=560555 RepID=A0ABN6A142_MYCNT|nr:hypothetical protein MMAN_07480 [Mycobacterium mantenii]